jgi:hypothetical protein
MVLLRHQAFAKPSSNQAAELDTALIRDLQTKARAHDLCPKAHHLIFRTPWGQPMGFVGREGRGWLGVGRARRVRALGEVMIRSTLSPAH